MTKLLVLYYSSYGHMEQMARQIGFPGQATS